jgi:hypothetical protein
MIFYRSGRTIQGNGMFMAPPFDILQDDKGHGRISTGNIPLFQ